MNEFEAIYILLWRPVLNCFVITECSMGHYGCMAWLHDETDVQTNVQYKAC